jgi:hypothetical protein
VKEVCASGFFKNEVVGHFTAQSGYLAREKAKNRWRRRTKTRRYVLVALSFPNY